MDPIKYIFEKLALTRRIARWQVLLSEYDIVYVTQKAIKGNALANFLAQQPINDYQSMQCEFPNESIMALFEEKESSRKEEWVMMFDAEYEACTVGIQAVMESKIKVLEVYGDSALVIHQLKGEWETWDAKLIPYQAYIKELIEYFNEITFQRIPCENNQLADALATLSSMFVISQNTDMPLIKMR
ncbi:uncharacterized protein LOC113851151 [Abrus precatorius]|uniref:Uncharacterized protein LOC113851151 n=1 Tax=Abrus precatorius TaxID=3816 RepID=A0A8B8K1Z9_ABRPR|nr:uncharacterized protein LOC113851151 [Abrus precatorius]